MRRVASSFCRIDLPLMEAVPLLHDDATTTIELFCEAPHLDVNGAWGEDVRWLHDYATTHGVTYTLHAPCFDLNPAAANRGARDEVRRQYMLALDVAYALGARQMVVHCGHRSDPRLSVADARSWTRRLLEDLVPHAARSGVRLVLENTGYGVAQILHTPGDLLMLVDGLPPEQIGLTLDLGHAALQKLDIHATIGASLPRLCNVHLHDNGGQDDDHLPPGAGVLPLAQAVTALQEQQYAGDLVMESFLGGSAPLALAAAWAMVDRPVSNHVLVK